MKSLFHRVPRVVLVLIGLAVFGLARGPLESHLDDTLVEKNLLLPAPAEDAVQKMSQSALIGTLGGLRSLVSSFLVLRAFDDFSSKNWEDLRQAYSIITNLEPRDENHWRDVVWHIGINATANMQTDETLPRFERERRFHEYALQAIDLAERGIEQLPESVEIRLQLAEVYREKLRDDCATARVFGEIKDLPGAPGYAGRFHGYFMARCPGREEEAYDYLMGLYRQGKRQHLPTLISEIKKLEKMLKISPERRIPDRDPDARRSPSGSTRSTPLPGGIVVP